MLNMSKSKNVVAYNFATLLLQLQATMKPYLQET